MTALAPGDLISDNLKLVSLPDIVMQINQMINDPASSAADISETISRDAALTARLLKIVNSPFYGFPSQIDTISMAITIVGTRQLRDLIMATAVVSKFNQLPTGLVTPEQFWRHNIAVAATARTLASRLQVVNTERFFIAGLLHDIGKLVMYLTQPDLSREVLERAGQTDTDNHELEHVTFGFDHAEVGAELLRRWRMPESLVEPTAFHHQPTRARHFIKETAIVHLANAIGNTIETPISADDDLPIDNRVWEILQLDPNELSDLTAESNITMQHALQIMFLELAA